MSQGLLMLMEGLPLTSVIFKDCLLMALSFSPSGIS